MKDITNINVHALNTSIGIKVFEFLNSSLRAKHPDLIQNIQIKIVEKIVKNNKNDVNVLFVSMPGNIRVNLDDYDLVLFSNADEPLLVSTSFIVKNISKKNCYLVSNSVVTKDHLLYDSIIPMSHDLLVCRQYWVNPVYPQYYCNQTMADSTNRNKDLYFINGENRSWRHHFLTLLKKEKINIDIRSNISSELIIHETNDAHWESAEDTEFRSRVNEMYDITRNMPTNYYNNSIQVNFITGEINEGLENKVSVIPPGYFILPEYYQYKCIIFPETTWQNNELAITEKSCKCFYSGAIPWPIGGANINQLYNQLGFKTAWNLLPDNLKDYDQELNHFKRYEKITTAARWLQDNLQVLSTPAAKDISANNKQRFLDHEIFKITADRLWDNIKNTV